MDVNESLLLIGVGGGGCQAAAAAARLCGAGLGVIGFDTDTAAIRGVEGARCVLLGRARLDGQGAAGDMVKGRLAAEEDIPGVLNAFEGVRTAVVVTTLGGGTGGGATPVLLDRLAELGVATLCHAVMPWDFEDPLRMEAARRALALIGPRAGTLVTLTPGELLAGAGLDDNAAMGDVMERCGRVLAGYLSFLWRLLLAPGYIRMDPERLRGLVRGGGSASALSGEAAGDGRAARAAACVVNNRTRDRLAGVQTAMLGVLAGPDLRLQEIHDIVQTVRPALCTPCRLEVATVIHGDYAGRVALILLAFDPVARANPGTLPAATPAGAPGAPSGKPARGKKNASNLRPTPAGRFQSVGQTYINGENFDIPTYIRKNIVIDH